MLEIYCVFKTTKNSYRGNQILPAYTGSILFSGIPYLKKFPDKIAHNITGSSTQLHFEALEIG